MKYYLCQICGNLVEKIEDGGNTPYCCGKPMQELSPASTDGALEKHVPVFECYDILSSGPNLKEILVKVGEKPHPSDPIHFIQWIELETNQGVFRKNLVPGDTPLAKFFIPQDAEIVAIYAYCNLHGLWKKVPSKE